jgi:hypothetical protein
MPNWNQVLDELQRCKRFDAIDYVRRKYLRNLQKYTKRNVIAYYSGWLRHGNIQGIQINDDDKNGFMAAVHGLDRKLGLDLILHTPGGEVAATESLVDYLRKMFGTDIRAIVPQIAMSAGTMIACSTKEIVLGKQSNLGPIDPQFGGIPAHGVIEEFQTALAEIKKDPASIPLWQVIVGKYHPTFLGECKHAIDWSKAIVRSWLASGMFCGDPNATTKAQTIVDALSDHNKTKTHSRHISIDECQSLGLKVSELEKDQDLQDLVLTVHHSYMHTFGHTNAIKIVENHKGQATVLQGRPLVARVNG